MKSRYLFYVYILTNEYNSVLYTGVTNSLNRRLFEHTTKSHTRSFSAKYCLDKLVYFEEFKYIDQAINREKQIKAGPRKKKMDLIKSINPDRNDLFEYYQ